jgi:hypothetical protein
MADLVFEAPPVKKKTPIHKDLGVPPALNVWASINWGSK